MSSSPRQPANSTDSTSPSSRRQAFHLASHLALADEDGVPVGAARRAQRRQSAQCVVDAVLWAHHSQIGEQVAPAATQRRVRLRRAKALEVGAVADDEDVGRVHPAPLDRYPPVGLVGRDHDVGRPQRVPLDPPAARDARGRRDRNANGRAPASGRGDRRRVGPPRRRAERAASKRKSGGLAACTTSKRTLSLGGARTSRPDPPERLPVLARVAERAGAGPERGSGAPRSPRSSPSPPARPSAAAAQTAATSQPASVQGAGLVPDPAVPGQRRVLADQQRPTAMRRPHAAPLPWITVGSVSSRIFRLSPSERRLDVLDVELDHLPER